MHEDPDTLIRAEWDGDVTENAQILTQEFADYLAQNKDEIEALQIYFTQPARRSEVTYNMIKSLLGTIQTNRPKLAISRVWNAYALLDEYKGDNPGSDLTMLVALIRRVCGIDATLSTHAATVRRNFQNWIMAHHSGAGQKFNEAQMAWLHMIRDHVINSLRIDRDALELTPFDAQGGLGRMYLLFGDRMDEVIEELNRELAA